MAVRSDRLVFGQFAGTAAPVTLYTVPPDRTLIVKRLELYHFGAGAGLVYVRGYDGANQAFIYLDPALAAPAFVSLERWDVLEDGDTLDLVAPVGNFCLVWVSGALLEGDPT